MSCLLSIEGILILFVATIRCATVGASLTARVDGSPTLTALVNFSNFPECAKADCIVSQSFAASRLGCKTANVTVGCICDDALTPLNCVPSGPSDEDLCWSNSEDWMLNQCGKANLIRRETIPKCMVECVSTYLVDAGCGPSNGTVSRNCFCKLAQLDTKLDKPNLPKVFEDCKKARCWKRMTPQFSYAEWKDGICTHGTVEKYNQRAYDGYVNTIKQTRIAIAVVIPIVAVIISCVCAIAAEDNLGFVWFFPIAALLYVAILVPLYFAL